MKIKYYLERIDRVLIFQVLEMDERFRDCGSVYKSNGFDISSQGEPEILGDDIFLRGSNKTRDLDKCAFTCTSIPGARDMEIRIHKALEDWALNWEGWKEETPKEGEHIYRL